MKALTTMAISKAISGKSKEATVARDAMTVGEHPVDVTVRLQGVVKVGEDTDKASTNSMLNQEFLAMVLYHAGVTRNAAAKIISEVADDYMADWDGSAEAKKEAKKARKAKLKEFDPEGKISAIFDGVKERVPRTPVRGSVKFVGKIEEVETEITTIESPEITIRLGEPIKKAE